MIELNILSPRRKQSLRRTNQLTFLHRSISLALFATIAVALILFFGKITLLRSVGVMMRDTGNESPSPTNEVLMFNQNLSAAEKIALSRVPWSYFLADFSSQVPPEVSLDSVHISNGQIVMSGHAQTRGSLVEFQRRLGQLPYFSTVNTPIENLLKHQDIDFSIKANLDLSSLTRYDKDE